MGFAELIPINSPYKQVLLVSHAYVFYNEFNEKQFKEWEVISLIMVRLFRVHEYLNEKKIYLKISGDK